MKIDIKRLSELHVITASSESIALEKARKLIYFLQHNNKNLTKRQEYAIDDLASIIDCMKA